MSTEKLDEGSAPDNFVLTSGGERLIGASSEEREVLGGLYEAHDKLRIDPKDNKELYQKLLDATTQGKKAKVLAARFIPMFFKHYPDLGATSFDALLDLVEDEDKQVRMSTIQYLPDICEGNKRYVIEIANVLGQLLVGCESEIELSHVEKSLDKLLKSDFSGTIDAMLEHVGNGFKNPEKEEDTETEVQARELAIRLSQKSLQFIMERVIRQRRYRELLTPETERAIRDKIYPLLEICDPKTFDNLIFLLRKLKIHNPSDADVYSELVQNVMMNSNLHTLAQSFQPTQKDELRKLLTCMKMSFPLYKKDFSNEKFLSFLMIKVLPQIPAMNDDLLSLDILHTLAEMSAFTSADDARKMIQRVYTGLVSQLPNAPAEGEETEPVVNFSYLEAYLMIFHHTAHKVPGMLNKICGISIYTGQPNEVDEDDHSSKKLDLNAKLLYAIKKAKEFRSANLEQLMRVANPDESKLAAQTRKKTNRVITNVIELGENLKRKSPRFDIPMRYSWTASASRGGQKRNRRRMRDQKSGRKRKADDATAMGAPSRKKKKVNPPPTQRRRRGGRGRNQGRPQGRPNARPQGRSSRPQPQPRRDGGRRDRSRGGPRGRAGGPSGGIAEMGQARRGGGGRY